MSELYIDRYELLDIIFMRRMKDMIEEWEERTVRKVMVCDKDSASTKNTEETVNMCQALEEWLADERAEGRAEGKLEIQRNYLLELLRGLGNISDSVRNRIMQECDMEQLFQWFKLASKADSLDAFEREMR